MQSARWIMRILILLLLILVLFAPPLNSQRVVRIPSTPTCDGCRIVLEPIARLGSADEPLSLISLARVVSDSEGNYYVAPTFEAGLIARYRRDGRFLGTIGRAGEGPGEFRRINGLVMAAGDTLHVFEGVRHTRLAATSGAYLGSANLPFPPRGRLYVPGYGVVIQYMDVGGGPVNQPLHLVNAAGEVVRSFGGDGKALPPEQSYVSVRAMGAARAGHLWSARINEYRIELWRMDGSPALTVIRDASWFRPWTEQPEGAPFTRRQRPTVTGVREDAAGRLWVTIIVPARDWRPRPGPGDSNLLRTEIADLYNTIIEVIDVENGRLLARSRYDRFIGGLGGSALVHGSRSDGEGNTVIDVWRLRLDSPATERRD